jgi:DNA-binding transcriptional LysR family regulator
MDHDAISLADLKCLADVAREGSFAAVARKRGVDPSIVSRTIASLEAELGFRLFDRTTRRLNLTEAGAIYLERSRTLVGELEAARQEAGDALRRPSGLVRITASTAFGTHWLTPRLRTFMEAYPDIAMEALLTDAVVDIAAERIDLAVRLAVRPEGELVATKLMDTRYHVVASSDYIEREGPLQQPGDLATRQCLLLTLPGYRSRWSFRRDGASADVEVAGRLAISSPAAIRSAALDGMGPALLADWMVQEDLRQGALVDLLPDWEATAAAFDTAAWLLYPSRDYIPAKVRVLIDFLRQNSR